MGCWNATDMVTGLPILCDEPVRCFVLQDLRQPSGHCPEELWQPVGPPVQGRYDDYGSVEKIRRGLAADWLVHLLPLDDEMKKGISGYGHEKATEVERKLLAVERGLSFLGRDSRSAVVTLAMVTEATWQKMLTLDHEGGRLSEEYRQGSEKRLRELAKLPTDEGGHLLLAAGSLLDYFAPFAAKMWAWCGDGKRDALVGLAVEFARFQASMCALRRCFAPMPARGSQSTNWEAHRAMAELVLDWCDAGIELERENRG